MGIQQKLQTRLAQKLILTPSLQQAIKLLPMSTLELADLLNQEVVENPLLEEVPTEDLQPVDAPPAAEKDAEAKAQADKTDSWDDADYEYFFGDYLDDSYRARRKRSRNSRRSRTPSPPVHRSPITSSGSCRCRPRPKPSARSAKPSSATSTTMATWWRRWTKSRRWDRGLLMMSRPRCA